MIHKVFEALDELFNDPKLSREDKYNAYTTIVDYLEPIADSLDVPIAIIGTIDVTKIGFDMFS